MPLINDNNGTNIEETENKEADSNNQFAEIKNCIDAHFEKVLGLVRYSKEKDANVIALSKQVQAYRDGMEYTLFKQIALEVIGYREDCRKSINDLAGKELSEEDSVKYLGYLKDDYAAMMENIGIEENDGAWLYNGKGLDEQLVETKIDDAPVFEERRPEQIEVKDAASLAEYLAGCEQAISAMISDNKILDTYIKSCIQLFAGYEKGVQQVILYPVIRAIIDTYKQLNCDEAESGANKFWLYCAKLQAMVDSCDKILVLCGVSIDGYVSDVHDVRKHRVLHMIETDNPDLAKHIAKRYTDCYCMGDRIIYPSKVDMYKVKQ